MLARFYYTFVLIIEDAIPTKYRLKGIAQPDLLSSTAQILINLHHKPY